MRYLNYDEIPEEPTPGYVMVLYAEFAKVFDDAVHYAYTHGVINQPYRIVDKWLPCMMHKDVDKGYIYVENHNFDTGKLEARVFDRFNLPPLRLSFPDER